MGEKKESIKHTIDKNKFLYGSGDSELSNICDGPACVDMKGEDVSISAGKVDQLKIKIDNFQKENTYDKNKILYGVESK